MDRCNLTVRVQNTNNAKIKLNGEVKSSISVPKGSAVSIEITADGFETYRGIAKVLENSTLDIRLTKVCDCGEDLSNKVEKMVEESVAAATSGLEEKVEAKVEANLNEMVDEKIAPMQTEIASLQEGENDLQGALETTASEIAEVKEALASYLTKEAYETDQNGKEQYIASIYETIQNVKDLKSELENKIEEKANITDLAKVESQASATSGDIVTINSTLEVMQKQIQALKTPITEPADPEAIDVVQPDKNVVISNGTISATKDQHFTRQIIAKSIQAEDVNVSSSRVIFNADDDVVISGFESSGNLEKTTANAAVSIYSNGDVKITNSTINQTGYNAIEIGLSNDKAPKNILIDGITFDSKMSNNAILIFAHQKDALITISNCHFKDVSNCVRLSNRLNVPAKVRFVNCTCDKWDTDAKWNAFLILEDYTSKTKDEYLAEKRFHNLDIQFVNCYGPFGKIEGSAEELFAVGEKRAAYIYVDADLSFPAYNEAEFPKCSAE